MDLSEAALLITLGDHYDMMTHVAKIIEIIGSSEKGWSEAAQATLNEAKKTIKGITGLEVEDITAKVDPNTGNITQYRVSVKIAFGATFLNSKGINFSFLFSRSFFY